VVSIGNVSRHAGAIVSPAEDPVLYRSRFQNDLAARMALLERPIGLAYLGQRIDLRDGDLEEAPD
jgi:hypothetical protein